MTNKADPNHLKKMCERSITRMSDQDALEHISALIDDSFDARFERGAKRALYLLDELCKRDLTDTDEALAEYFKANASSTMSHIAGTIQSYSWEAPFLQAEMLALSRAANHSGFPFLDKLRRCQILTNHANLLNKVGRTIDAIATWDEALKIVPQFAMALGNRGWGLKYYAGMLTTDRERAIVALHAFDSFQLAISDEALYESGNQATIKPQFADKAMQLACAVNVDVVRSLQDLDSGEKGRSSKERAYRRWSLENRLFLCPLNDLGAHFAAATDSLMLPSISEDLNSRPHSHIPPEIFGFFSQMKQEYASARFMLFEGVSSRQFHFSDREVHLTDTLDYPIYSLASERVRTAFRITYSLLDKVAFIVNHYWNLGKQLDRISFKNVWMTERKSTLLPQLEKLENHPLRGLFWLSKELFDDELKQTTSSDAQDLHNIRNALEHTYLRVIEGWAKPLMLPGERNGDFGITVGSDELEAKAVRVMQIARSALFYLCFAIGAEEDRKRQEHPDRVSFTMPLSGFEDKRKRRDPI